MDSKSPGVLPVILAGGGGSRLWPLSREHYPKQFLTLYGEYSLLQMTMLRLNGLSDSEVHHPEINIEPSIVICNEEHRFLVAEQSRLINKPSDSIILEPVGKNTAPALTVAAHSATEAGKDPVLLVMPADHVIQNETAFHKAVTQGAALADQGGVITFGISPDKPETGFGYIEQGAQLKESQGAYQINAFVEKPDEETAKQYLAGGGYLWNSGIFMVKASVWLSTIEKYQPEMKRICAQAYDNGTTDGCFYRLDKQQFELCPSDSIDFAVMEHLSREPDSPAMVLPLDAAWSDVGVWSSLWDISDQDECGNVVQGDTCLIDSTNNLAIAEHRFLAVLGCSDLVVVETSDSVLVIPKNRSQDVKQITSWLHSNNRDEGLMHKRVYRPWGSYESVDAGSRFQVKRLTVNPKESLSLQMHHHRAEHWIVVAGTARVTRADETFVLSENESTYIPLGVSHRLENPGSIPLEVIEVQSGSYLGEDDIVRFEDIYNRG